jgi:hypothetical protein
MTKIRRITSGSQAKEAARKRKEGKETNIGTRKLLPAEKI